MLQPVRVLSLSTQARYEASISEHIGIVDGMLARDSAQAAVTLQTHLDEAEACVLQVLEKQSSAE